MTTKFKKSFSPMLICWNDIKIHLGFEDSYFVPPPTYSHPDLLLIHHPTTPLFQITPVLNTGLSLSEPLQLYQTAFVYVTAISVTFCNSVLGAFVTKPLNQTHSHLNDKPVNGRKKP